MKKSSKLQSTLKQIIGVFSFLLHPSLPAGNMTKGAVVAIVMLIFLLVFLVVDATCCYRNRCGLLMFIAVKLFGQKIPALKGFEEGDGTTNGLVDVCLCPASVHYDSKLPSL